MGHYWTEQLGADSDRQGHQSCSDAVWELAASAVGWVEHHAGNVASAVVEDALDYSARVGTQTEFACSVLVAAFHALAWI